MEKWRRQLVERGLRVPSGFTLIELLIVVAIIAILAAIAVPNFLEAQMRAKVVSVKADMKNIITAQELYRADNGDYVPDTGGNWDTDYNSLFALSTPVAYIVQVPLNPFFDKYNAGTLAKGNFSYWRNWPEKEKTYSMFYGITSVGPNGTMDMTPDPEAISKQTTGWVNTVYNPTNGTKSFGDLGCTNKGIFE